MRHAQDLAALRDRPELVRDLLCRPAADAGVDLVKDHGPDGILRRQHVFHCQHDARQLAAGGDLRQRPQRLADVGGHQEADGVQAVFLRRLLRKLADEADLRHIELHELGGDLTLQALRGRFAGFGQCRALLQQRFLQAGELFLQLLDAVGGEFHLVELPFRFFQKCQNILHAAAVFALELMERIEPLFDLLELVRGVGQIVFFVAQLVGDVLRGVHEVVELAAERAHLIGHATDLFQRVRGVGDHGGRTVRGFVAVERGHSRFDRVGQLFRILQDLPAFEQLLFLAGLQLCALDLVDLEFQSLDQPQLFRLVHRQPTDLLPDGADLVIGLPVAFQQRLVVRKQVQIPNMRRLVKQLLGVVLPVDLDELDAEPAERGDRDGFAAHAAAVLPVGKDLAGDAELRLVRNLILREPRQLRHAGKDGADKRFLRAGADHLAGGPFTQNGRDRVDDDRLARAGLAGEDIEAAVKRDLCLFNDGNIFDVQGRKHRFPSCSVREAASMHDLLPDLRAEAGCRLRVLQNDKAGVVAGKRAEHLRDVQLVDRGGRAVGKTRHGLDDDHVLGVIHAGDALPEDEIQLGRERMLHGLRRGGIAVDTVRSELLDDAQLLDIAGDRRLRGPEARVVQLREQLLLRLHAVVMDELQNFFLAF